MSNGNIESTNSLREFILEELRRKPGLTASELATVLGRDRREVSRCLTYDLAGKVHQGTDYRWRLAERDAQRAARGSGSTTEISRLCRYYLECISQEMEEGVRVFARNESGDPSYAQLPSLPIDSDDGWWNSREVGKLLGKVRAGRGKLMAWMGYPVRLHERRTARRDGFFVEPILIWPLLLPERNGDAPSFDDRAPRFNTKFLRRVTMGDGAQLAEEVARLERELGLGAPAEQPEVDDIVQRLVRIRPEWDWKEELRPDVCRSTPLSEITDPGIYNCAVIVPAERSPFTEGLESELEELSGATEENLRETALGRWLTANIPIGKPSATDSDPLIEVLPMNTEQRAAVRTGLTQAHTVVTGPPGTGKSQVVTNLLVNAAWRGMKVLFASKNNKAVDVVEARVNELANRPVLLRLGSNEYQARLAAYLPQLLAGNPGAEVEANYVEALGRHRSIAAQLAELDKVQQQTMERRNAVDQLDADAEEGRQLFGTVFATITRATYARADRDLRWLRKAIDGVDPGRQGLLTRLLWRFLRGARERRLVQRVRDAAGTVETLRITWLEDIDDVPTLRAKLHQLSLRVALARIVVEYREALAALQQSRSFETIAEQRRELIDEASENATTLWRDWVHLAPARLTAEQRKDVADFVAALELMTGSGASRIHASVKKRARILQSKVTALFSCWGITSLSARGRIPMEPGFFDLVVIDEASQCDIASALPLLYRAKRSVIIGDPMQLRHISVLDGQRDSELQHKHGLVENRLTWMYSVNSLFDVAASIVSTANVINLRDHHRSHADIIGFSNQAFYEGRLRVATRQARLNRPSMTEPGVVWHDVSGSVVRPPRGGAQNEVEARAVVDALVNLLVCDGFTGSAGVVTPFRAQAQLLQSLIQSRHELDEVSTRAELLVDTVHKFQGDERDVMFFSPVISKGISLGALGFLRSNGNLFNVAITRARGLLHVIGDRSAAATCGVDYLEKFAAYVSDLETAQTRNASTRTAAPTPEYPTVTNPERVSEWERVLYRAMVAAGLHPIPQYSEDQYDLDFALLAGDRKLAVEVDGERYHRSWTGELCLSDQLRNQRLIELGWDVQRFWVYEIRDELELCVRRLKDWVAGARADST
jgi:very-short-patch-repair endonuclease